MPLIFGTTVSSASYLSNQITANGEAFADTVYAGISNIEVSLTGLSAWTAVDTIDSWSDTQVIGSFLSSLLPGTYDVRVTSSDGEVSNTLVGGFVISGNGGHLFGDLALVGDSVLVGNSALFN